MFEKIKKSAKQLTKKLLSALNIPTEVSPPPPVVPVKKKTGLDFSKLDKKQKRSVTIPYNGRRIKVLEYIDMVAKKMPVIQLEADLGIVGRLDHIRMMRHEYYTGGIDALNEYIKTVASWTQTKAKEESENVLKETAKIIKHDFENWKKQKEGETGQED